MSSGAPRAGGLEGIHLHPRKIGDPFKPRGFAKRGFGSVFMMMTGCQPKKKDKDELKESSM